MVDFRIWFLSCSSPVGYSTRRPNRISLAKGCWRKGTVIHEIAHSLGFYHEQSRPDRDDHVIIRWENIPDYLEYNFKKQKSDNIDSLNVPYDYRSVMHYSKTAFGGGRITIQTKNPSMQDVIGRRSGFSELDIKQMNLLYKCSGVTPPTQTPTQPPTKPPTQRPTKPPQPDCKDVLSGSRCQRYKRNCKTPANSSWGKYLRKYCRKTCNFCGTGPVTPVPPTDCKDRVIDCHRFKQKCSRPADDPWGSYLRRNCKRTCRFCGSGGKTTHAPVTQPPVTQPGTPGPTSEPGKCGVSSVQSGRVIAGENAKKGAWPWQILMLYNGRTSCGGSLVAPGWVVTAAHCVAGREHLPKSYQIRVGEHDSRWKDDDEDDIPVSKIISHPNYSRRTIDSDIALMKLSRPAKMGRLVSTVCLPGQDKHVPVGTQCYITGWGKIRHPGSMHHTLQQGKFPVVSKKACYDLNTKNLGIKITDNMVCAGHGGSTRVSGCHGDSGGPFVCQTGKNGRWELHGAVSWGSGRCDATKSYTVFARVAVFRKWIDETMRRY